MQFTVEEYVIYFIQIKIIPMRSYKYLFFYIDFAPTQTILPFVHYHYKDTAHLYFYLHQWSQRSKRLELDLKIVAFAQKQLYVTLLNHKLATATHEWLDTIYFYISPNYLIKEDNIISINILQEKKKKNLNFDLLKLKSN